IRYPDIMLLGCPVDTGEESSFILVHPSSFRFAKPSRWIAGPCTGARWRRLPTGPSSWSLRWGTRPHLVLIAQGVLGCSRRIGLVRQAYAGDQRLKEVQGVTLVRWA